MHLPREHGPVPTDKSSEIVGHLVSMVNKILSLSCSSSHSVYSDYQIPMFRSLGYASVFADIPIFVSHFTLHP